MGKIKADKQVIAILVLAAVLVVVIIVGIGGQKKDEEEPTETQEEETQEITFSYKDAGGRVHTTILDTEAAMHSYDWGNLSIDGQDVSYDDGTYETVFGVDVSYHQGDIDWNAVAEDGVKFAILRVGYRGYGQDGTLNEDVKFRDYIDEAHSAGLDVGVYFFSQAINEDEAREEADFVLDIISDYEIELPVVYDPESIADDEARTDELTGEQATKNTIAFCEEIEEAGYEPMVYSNMVWEADYFDMSEVSGYKFWYADYESYPQTPYDFCMWQYTESGSISGISGGVDLDVMFRAK